MVRGMGGKAIRLKCLAGRHNSAATHRHCDSPSRFNPYLPDLAPSQYRLPIALFHTHTHNAYLPIYFHGFCHRYRVRNSHRDYSLSAILILFLQFMNTSQFISFLKTNMRNPKIFFIIGFFVIVIFAVVFIRPAKAPVENTQEDWKKSWQPEALALVESIDVSTAEWNVAKNELALAEKAAADAKMAKFRAEAAAMGADLLLCARYQAIFDRSTRTLLKVKECPLQ